MAVGQWIRGLPVGVVAAIKGAFDYPNSIGLTATGTTQGTALPLPRDFNVFSTVAASTGCILPWGIDQIPTANAALTANLTQSQALTGLLEIGDEVKVINRGANTLSVYPQTGGTIQGGAANAAFSVAANKVASLYYVGGGNFVANLSA